MYVFLALVAVVAALWYMSARDAAEPRSYQAVQAAY
jgi:hypothetical protein